VPPQRRQQFQPAREAQAAAAQSDSTAVTLADLVADFNALLAKLENGRNDRTLARFKANPRTVALGMASIAVCNIALSEIRANPIVSIDDGSPEADACAQHYDDCFDTLIECHEWGFAKKRVPLRCWRQRSFSGMALRL
jgi:hypothetical protein